MFRRLKNLYLQKAAQRKFRKKRNENLEKALLCDLCGPALRTLR